MDNPILKKQTLTILQQIEELKNWHKQQQSKLDTDVITEKCDTFTSQRLENITCKNLTMPQLEKKSVMQKNFDEIPIKVANPNFNKIIENNINPNDNADKNHQNGEKPKFKFLKRGEGIARFRMGPQKISKSNTNNIRTLNLSRATKVPDIESNSFKDQQFIVNEHRKDNVDTLNPPDLKLNMNNWKSIFEGGKAEEIIEKAISSNQLDFFHPDSSVDSSFMEKFIAVGKKHIREREELKVFEAIEQHLLDSSFCSNSSYVARLMENAVISTPIKNTLENKKIQDIQTKTTQLPTVIMQNKEETVFKKSTEHLRPQPGVWKNTESFKEPDTKLQDSAVTDNLEQSLHVRFADEVDYKSFVDYSQSVDNSHPNVANIDKKSNESEEWKEESEEESICCSQCSTTYSSSDEDVKAISPPGKPPPKFQNRFPKYDSLQKNMQVNKIAANKLDVEDLTTKNEQNKNTISSIDEMEQFPPVLGAKLKELEAEIETFREENKKLKALRETLEKERKQFLIEKKKFLIEFEEERKKNTAWLEEEKQKLSKEKFTFEKYSKSLTKNPSKEERKEMQGLKEQLTELKEELNRKESRWGAAQARVRNQVKVLEADNKKLREEVEVLRKQAKHLEFLTNKTKSKPVNNTKLIHAFNEYFLNTPDDNEGITKSLSLGGYFDSKPISAKTVVVHGLNPKHNGTTKVIKEKGKESSDSGFIANSVEQTYMPTATENKTLGTKSPYTTKPFQHKNEVTVQRLEKISPTTKGDGLITSPKGVINEDGSVENTYSDGRKEIRFKNGNVKRIDPFSGNEKTIYFNGDVKESLTDGTVKYYFSESRIWHTTLPDGLEVLDFPNGQVEKRHTNGMVEIVFPNECRKLSFPDGSEEIHYSDGTKLKIDADKRKILSLPNGQREVHTDECVQREYPDGTVKKVYHDGVTETIYANGRVRLKDKHGNLVMDSATSTHRL